MRCVATPEFTAKTRGVSVAATVLPSVGQLLTQLQIRTLDALLSGLGQVSLRPFKGDVYIAANADIAIVARVTSDAAGEFLQLLDVIQNHLLVATGPASPKDPRANPLLNPRINSEIDPHLNAALDPNRNDAINPRLNPALNPRQTPAINPRMNADVNPRLNREISPTVQLLLNPKHNPQINPNKNSQFDGGFCYDTNLKRNGFLVPADDRVQLLFALDLSFGGCAVRCVGDYYVVFDAANNWTGFLVPDLQGNALRFSATNKWDGVVIW